ncbi:MAG: EamA-like transporter family protein [Chthoniobacteraceae bacterium]|nr:EamA-like transporter family protein [Chthoniobacteraceae bacterium]
MSEPILSIRKPLDNLAATVMVGLCLCWGLQQVAIKAAASSMEPVLQVGLRSLFAALLVAGLMIARRENLSLRDGTFRPGLLVGILFGGEFLAVSLGLNFTTAGHMAVFLYTAPIFTALGLHWLVREEQMRRRQWTGLGMAFAGIALAFSGSLFTPGGTRLLLGDMLGVLGGILWAATTLTIRVSRLSETSAAKTLLYQLSGAAILLLPIAWYDNDSTAVVPSAMLWASLVFQTVVVAFTSFLLWFWLLRKYLASRLSIFSFLTPLFGVLFGVLFLKEPLDPRFVLGAMLVLAGITIVNRK